MNEQGITMQTVPKIVYALSLIPSDVNLTMKLLLLALSQPDIQSFKVQRTGISEKIIEQRTESELDDNVLEGGATPDQAKQIIINSINTLDSQGFLPPGSADRYRRALGTAAIGFDPTTVKQQLEEDIKRVKENAAAYIAAQQEAQKARVAQVAQMPAMTDSMAMVASGSQKLTMMDRAKSAASNFGSLFSKKSTAMVPGAVGMPMFSGDSCGNNTNITCNGEDLIISVSLKLSDLISSCVDPDMIEHINRALGAGAIPSASAPPLLTGADAAVEVGGSKPADAPQQSSVQQPVQQTLQQPVQQPVKPISSSSSGSSSSSSSSELVDAFGSSISSGGPSKSVGKFGFTSKYLINRFSRHISIQYSTVKENNVIKFITIPTPFNS
ncbi:MAG: hypothetical protein EB127_24430 [Alphaproteobacteria bacterium]|nr:hypothetical protein [Alphaproteobacteria bacterium]